MTKSNVQTHLLRESALARNFDVVAWPRVTTTGVAPQPRKVVLRSCSPMEQDFTRGVSNENREGSVKLPRWPMNINLGRRPKGSVFLVNQNDLVAISSARLSSGGTTVRLPGCVV